MNILFVRHNKKELCHAYVLKNNYKCKNQVILLMITDDGKRWHYLAVRSLSALLRGISSSNNGDFYCLNCFHSYRTLNKLKKRERVCNNQDYCHIDMPEKGGNILKCSLGDKSLKAPFTIYADLECLLKKEQSCQSNPKNSYTQTKAKHKPLGHSLSLICSFDETKNRHNFFRRKDCIKRFCNDLKELATEIINYEEKKLYHSQVMMLLFIKSKTYVIYAKEDFVMIKIKKVNLNFIIKLEIIFITPENLEGLLIIFAI